MKSFKLRDTGITPARPFSGGALLSGRRYHAFPRAARVRTSRDSRFDWAGSFDSRRADGQTGADLYQSSWLCLAAGQLLPRRARIVP